MIKPGPRERNPKRWCSERCRVRAHRAQHGPKFYAPRCTVKFLDCSECGRFCCRPTKGAPTTCSPDCQRRKQARLERERVAREGIAQQIRARVADYRAGLTDAQRDQVKAVTKAWRQRNGRVPSMQAADARRRARKAGADAEKFLHAEIFERDGWVCGICTGPIDRTLLYPDPMSVSLDHIVPLSLGGPHTRANTRAAHLVCNVDRGAARGEVLQLALA